jgi:HK97 family phage major capsid protein
MTVKELVEARAQALSEARQIVDRKDQTPEDEAQYQKALDEFRRLDRLVTDEQAFMKAEAEAREARAEVEEIVRPKEIRKVEDRHEAEVREFIVPGSERKSLWIPMPEKRHAVIGSDGGANAYGSYTIPEQWWKTVQMHVNAQSGVLASNCTVIRTTTGEEINIPTLATDAAALIGAQAVASTETNPVFGQAVLNAYRLDGHFTVSKEFLEDTSIDTVSFLQDCAGRAIATLAASYAASGTGGSQPQGLNYTTEPTSAGKTAAAQTTFTMDELWDLYLAVLPGYRARGEWVAGSTAYGIIMKFKDDEGRYLVSSPTASEPALLIGKPLREDAGYQATTTGLVPLTFGDMSTFWVRYARGMEFTRDDSVAFTSFASTFRFAVWFDTELVDRSGSIKHLLMA